MSLSRNKTFGLILLLLLGITVSTAPGDSLRAGSANSETLNLIEREGVRWSALAAPAKFVSPEAAAKSLYNAWRKGSRRAALKVATRSAVNTLFGNSWKTFGPMKFKGCESNNGTFVCRYFKGSGVLEMYVEGGASLGGYNVVSVQLFSAAD